MYDISELDRSQEGRKGSVQPDSWLNDILGIWIVAAYSVLQNNDDMMNFVYNYGITHTVADVSFN